MKKTLLFLMGSCLLGLSQGDLFCEGDKINASEVSSSGFLTFLGDAAAQMNYHVFGLFIPTSMFIPAKNEKRDVSPTSVDRVKSLVDFGKVQQISKGILKRKSSSKDVNLNNCPTSKCDKLCPTPKCSNGNFCETQDCNDSMDCPTPTKLTIVIVPSLVALYCASHPSPDLKSSLTRQVSFSSDVISRSRTNSDEYGQLYDLQSSSASPATPRQRKQLIYDKNQDDNGLLKASKYSKGSNLELQGIHGYHSPCKLSKKVCGTPVITEACWTPPVTKNCGTPVVTKNCGTPVITEACGTPPVNKKLCETPDLGSK